MLLVRNRMLQQISLTGGVGLHSRLRFFVKGCWSAAPSWTFPMKGNRGNKYRLLVIISFFSFLLLVPLLFHLCSSGDHLLPLMIHFSKGIDASGCSPSSEDRAIQFNRDAHSMISENHLPSNERLENDDESEQEFGNHQFVIGNYSCYGSPSKKRRIQEISRQMWTFLSHQLNKLQHIDKLLKRRDLGLHTQLLKYTLEHAAEYHRVIDAELKEISQEGASDDLRRQEAQELQEEVQRRLYRLQNPENCSKAEILVCNLTNPHGFASGVHDVLWCFIKAYHSQKMLVLVTTNWHYAPRGWETMFRPLSDSCYHVPKNIKSHWPGLNNAKARNLMTKLPRDIGPRLLSIHGNPLAWWYGQFILYLMRPSKSLQSFLENIKAKIGFESNIVGIHVRRTDKIGNEAKFHSLEEYMHHVEDYFRGLEMTSSHVVRKVYIATDDPSVVQECTLKFPAYTCIYNPGSANMASDMSTRYSNASLWGVYVDVFMLANTDFLVCTLSSGLCRLAYELMQALQGPDAADRVQTLDVEYHYAWVPQPPREALYNHEAKSRKELSFRKGDILIKKDEHSVIYEALQGKIAKGFVNRVNTRTGEEGMVPSYKTREIFKFTDFPIKKKAKEGRASWF